MADRLAVLSAALAGRYRFEPVLPDGSPLLGQGGMALVYAARDLKLDRDVAIKVLRPDLGRLIGPDRFLREIGIAAGLSHPHILPLFDSGEAAGLLYYVMPRVRGESLRERLDREPVLPLNEALRIAREVADALDYAHRADVIHRDIKPENIMLADGHALVADFGVARSISGRDHEASGDVAITGTGLAVGTVMYMSPEQRSGQKELDGRTDLYSLGCVLFEMLTGSAPGLAAGSPAEGTRSDPVVRALHAARPDLSDTLDPLLQRALAADPRNRFASAAEMLAALDRVRPKRHLSGRWAAVGAGLVAVLLIAVAIWILRGRATGPPGLLLVAEFASAPSDSALASTVHDLVTAELNQPSRLLTMTPEMLGAARRAAGMPDTARLDLSRARELAERSGARVAVTGSVQRLGSANYTIILRALEPKSGGDLAVASGTATDTTLVAKVGDLARQLRHSLGERSAELATQRPLWQVTTPSLPAYRDYVAALREVNVGGIATANRLLYEALAKDSGFASAWLALAANHLTDGQVDSAAAALARARALPDRLRDVDRYSVEALSASAVHGDPAAAIPWYDLILRTWPYCLPALNERGFYLASIGRYEEALADFDRALALVSFGEVQGQIELLNRSATLLILGRVTEARAAAVGLSPAYREFFDLLPPVAESRWPEAESLATAVSDDPRAWSRARRQAGMTRIAAKLARGQTSAGLRLLRAGAEGPPGPVARWYQRTLLVLCQAAGCDPGPPPRSLPADSSAAGQLSAGLWSIARGDTLGARAARLRLAAADTSTRAKLGNGPLLLEAMIEAHGGRWRRVADLLREPAEAGEHDIDNLDRPDTQSLRVPLAEAYAHLGLPDSAARMFDAAATARRIPVSALATRGIIYPFALRRAAELYALAGEPALAAERRALLARTIDRPEPEWRP